MSWSPLTTHFAVNLTDSVPRNAAVEAVQNHHTATNNKYNALASFAPGGREVTPNYFVAGKEVWGIVPENRRAYTSGSAYDDHRAITIETLNLTNAPDWQFASDTMATLILLNADIAKRYGVPVRHELRGIYEHRNINAWTGRSYATACAGPSFNISSFIAAVASADPGTNKDQLDIEEEEDMPILIARTDGKNRGEWTLIDPSYGSDLASGAKREEVVVDVNGNRHTVFVKRGYMVSTSPTVGAAWGRTYCRSYGSVPMDLLRTAYVEAQATADLAGAEYQRNRRS